MAHREIKEERRLNSYLSVVLAKYRGQYVTWIYNHEDGGYHHGHYFKADEYDKAYADFLTRG